MTTKIGWPLHGGALAPPSRTGQLVENCVNGSASPLLAVVYRWLDANGLSLDRS
ncbi:hypothetical protein [Aureliella helgolandensis]|uniref:hypothetical protein n=1 Tax=Aureliella helgolandensis TaxID=2527968 RepID=UPI0018D0C30F|nr:hypothetical protein [Aureliella helgolandensis]